MEKAFSATARRISPMEIYRIHRGRKTGVWLSIATSMVNVTELGDQ